jgi:hypothetical protein
VFATSAISSGSLLEGGEDRQCGHRGRVPDEVTPHGDGGFPWQRGGPQGVRHSSLELGTANRACTLGSGWSLGCAIPRDSWHLSRDIVGT